MHYYQFNIGDYASHTRHLSLIEDIAYRRLLDIYYLHEQPLSADVTKVARLLGMRDNFDEVEAVLTEFFELSDDGWINTRADNEIAHFQSKIEQASKAGKASAERRSNGRSTGVELNNKQETINIKHKTKNTATTVAPPDGVSDSVWQDFKALRKAKRAPLTQRAIDGIIVEAKQAGWPIEKALTECCIRGWQAFKAEWVLPKVQADVVRMTVPSRNTPDPTLMRLKAEEKIVRPPNLEELAKLAELRRKA